MNRDNDDTKACRMIFAKEGTIGGDSLKIGVSACLLGEKVRYDGGHKLDLWIRDVLGRFVEFIPVCPEVDCGLPVPREAMHLAAVADDIRLVTVKTGIDHTERMRKWAQSRLQQLETEEPCGFIFKSKSPSSGMERVKVYGDKGVKNTGVGIWARMFMDHFPYLPVEEEGRLNDAVLRENFIERLFVMKRFRDVSKEGFSYANLLAFHSGHKLLLMAHSPALLKEMGRLLAGRGDDTDEDIFCRYLALLDRVMRTPPTIKRHVNVLSHAMGYFRKQLSGEEKRELLEVIDNYAKGYTPLIVPITLVNHYVLKYGEKYLSAQHYLRPHPIELKLRNHA